MSEETESIEKLIKKNMICPECHSDNITHDETHVITSCDKCGLVLYEPYPYVAGIVKINYRSEVNTCQE